MFTQAKRRIVVRWGGAAHYYRMSQMSQNGRLHPSHDRGVIPLLSSFRIHQATIHDLDMLTPLFDAYRQFYQKPADAEAARAFLADRFAHHESIILLAQSPDEHGFGFTQLYPLFSSVRVARTYLLNDLFVAPEARRLGVARRLLEEAARFARAQGAVGLSLSTAHSNLQAQTLYESLGWQHEQEFREYSLNF
jgi:ribosomal protein S18 acetylase RimI-like enzyme